MDILDILDVSKELSNSLENNSEVELGFFCIATEY